MRRTRRIAGIALAVILGIVLLAFLGLRVYHGSDAATQLASEKLTEKFGSEVKVTRLESGLGSTSAHIEIAGHSSNVPPLVDSR